jgi:cytochrome bd-type quinol oxidase subunit 1
MNYPVWYLPNIGGGTLIAIIAIFHVVIAHLAVGGGLFLVLIEMKALKSGDSGIMAYVKSHTAFFMILTMIFGGLSGVGIWFIISLVSPDATSSLIHNFVFGWAIEWVFFVCEIAALLIYHYRFDKMDRRSHVIIGWLYFIFAWLSLFIINGILGFMLTPGRWMETGNFWHGFFNPGFMPGLIFRTCVSAIFAGIFGLITASFRKNYRLRSDLMKYCAKWIYAPVLLLVLSGIYYTSVMSDEAYRNLFHANPEARIYVRLLILSSAALFTLGLFTIIRIRAWQQKTVAFAMARLCVSWMAAFEYMREIARKPYILYGQMYSNAISPSRMKEIGEKGFLHAAKWSRIKTVTPSNMLEAGEEIFRLQCMACHTVNGYNGIRREAKA